MTNDVRMAVGAELPDITAVWRDSEGTLIDFSSGWTFTLKLNTFPPFVKTTGITGAATSPNVRIAFAAGELDDLPPGTHRAQLWAKRGDGKDRVPLDFRLVLEADFG